MFGLSKKTAHKEAYPPPSGVAEIVFCVFDEKHRLLHRFSSNADEYYPTDQFQFLNDSEHAFDYCILREATDTGKPVSLSMGYGEGIRKCLYVLPYECKKQKMRFACLQVSRTGDSAEGCGAANGCILSPDRFFLLLAGPDGSVRSTSSSIPKAFGYAQNNLIGMNLNDLFSSIDLEIITSSAADTADPILSCVFFCPDGARRDVEIRKYSAPDHFTLYAISDTTPAQFAEELSQVTTRERRRIGQDLHDSLGQLLTGISLLSRSLANSLKLLGNGGDTDALQISALADDASNQIRQISRGLMPSEIVQKGLFESLRELADTTTSSCGVPCVASLDVSVELADRAVETHLYRIAQEAVNNAVRHAEASRIDIMIARINGVPRLEIRDDGTWKGNLENRNGIGMRTMQYRASAIGGHLKVGALPEGGSRVACVLETEDVLTIEARP